MNETEAKDLRERIARQFNQIPAWISYGTGLKHLRPSELKVYVYLCACAHNQTKITLPSSCTREKISHHTGVSLGTISAILHSLEISGYIRILKEGRSNSYVIQFAPPDHWPLHGPTNAARTNAAAGRRQVLRENCSSPHSHHAQGNTTTPEPDSSPILDF